MKKSAKKKELYTMTINDARTGKPIHQLRNMTKAETVVWRRNFHRIVVWKMKQKLKFKIEKSS